MNLFDENTYLNDLTVQIGLHDGRMVEEGSIEISERLINRLQYIARAYNQHLSGLIDCQDDILFNAQQCRNLLVELDFISRLVNDPLLEKTIGQINTLALRCISKNNRRINLYFSGN